MDWLEYVWVCFQHKLFSYVYVGLDKNSTIQRFCLVYGDNWSNSFLFSNLFCVMGVKVLFFYVQREKKISLRDQVINLWFFWGEGGNKGHADS